MRYAQGLGPTTPELIGIITVGVALAALILGYLGPSLRELRRDIGDLRERIARIEGMLEWIRPAGPPTNAQRFRPGPREVNE